MGPEVSELLRLPTVYGSVRSRLMDEMPAQVTFRPARVAVERDVVAFPKHFLASRSRREVLPQTAPYWGNVDGLEIEPPPGKVGREAMEAAFVVDCRYHQFGHILLEAVPRLALLSQVPDDVPIVTSLPLSPTLLTLASALGVKPERFRHSGGAVFCATAYLPDPVVELSSWIQPVAREAFDRLRVLGTGSGVTRVERLYLSRSGQTRRRLVNEDEIEALFERLGFSIVRPEEHDIETQVALISGARMIAGLGGSAMHSAVFASAGTPVLIVSSRAWVAPVDVFISQANGPLGFVFGEPLTEQTGMRAPWSVDPLDVERAIRSHFGL